MRIHRIEIENLASLRGQQPSLDLTGELRDAGLVAITGATGAGKTTILDAVCLALFDQTPRLRDRGQDPRELLSRGAGEGSASVELELDDGRRWIVEWAVHRARNEPDGNLQPSRRRIVDAATGQTVAEGKRDVSAEIESALDLDFDQFTGVILLAQGEFAKFLQAGDADRSQLLERLTGTEIYSRISQAAFERHRDRQQAVRQMEERLQDVRTLGREERRAKEEELDVLAPRLLGLVRRLEELEEQSRWLGRLDALRVEARESAKALEAAEGDWRDAEPEQERLVRAERAALLAANLGAAVASRQAETEAAQALEDARVALDEAEEERRRVLEALAREMQRFDVRRLRLEEGFAEVERFAGATDPRIGEVRDGLRSVREARDRLAHLRAQLDRLSKELDEAAATRRKHAAGRDDAAETVESLEATQRQLTDRRDDLTGGRTPEVLTARKLRLAEALKVHADFEALDLEGLTSDEAAAQADQRGAETSLREASEAVVERRQELEDHERLVQLAIEHAKLAQHRHVLEDGVPCPLCGSEDHPWAEHPPDETDAALERARRRTQDLKQALAQEQVRQEETAKAAAHAREAAARVEERRRSAEREISKLRGEWVGLRLQIVELPGDPADFEREGPQEEVAELETILEEIRPIEAEIAAKGESLVEARERLHHHETKREVADERVRQIESSLAERQTERDEASRQLDEHVAALADAATSLAAACGMEAPAPAGDAKTGDAATGDLAPFDELLRDVEEGRDAHAAAREARRRLEEIQRGPVRRGRERLADFESGKAGQGGDAEDAGVDLDDLEQALDERLKHAEQADDRRRVLADRRESAAKALAVATERRLEADAELRDALVGSPFADEDDLRRASLDGESMDALRQRLDALRQTKIRRAADDERSRRELAKHVEGAPPALDGLGPEPDDAAESSLRAHLQTDLESVRERHRQSADRKTVLTVELQRDDEDRARLAKLSGDLERLEAARDRAHRLYDLIGSQKGNKFRDFAQQLNLDQLLALANARLGQLEPRYELDRAGETLDLEVIDRDMADERRPVSTLSGGESFLVSLSLALALADLRRGRLELGTLFLDEGFGSLDEDTLDQALAVLENLQADQKTQILVISHVGALQERIAHRIDVRKRGGGQSRLRVLPRPPRQQLP